MSINVYSFPPVSLKGWSWTVSDPVEQSASIISGAAYLSAAQRSRRVVALAMAGISRNGMGAGYVESLKVLLKGGINCVRLYSMPINFTLAHETEYRQSNPLLWSADGDDLEWTSGGSEMLWYSGTYLTGTTGTDSEGWAIVTVSGLAPGVIAARPSEFITIFANVDDTVGTTVRVLTAAVADANGDAVIRLHESPGVFTDARISLGTRDTGVFRCTEMPTPMQTAADWTYTWEFREVFAEEVGGFEEIDPW